MIFRDAKSDELNTLNLIIKDSKASWGYSEAFIQKFMDKFALKQEYLEKEQVSVLTNQNDPIAVIGFSHEEPEPMLDYFFLMPQFFHQGLGRKMWEHAEEIARKNGWDTFIFYSEPHSEAFYKHMGAQTIGQFESFPGRFVPIMKYLVKKDRQN